MPQIRVGILTENRLLWEGLFRILGADSGLALSSAANPEALAEMHGAEAPEVMLLDAQMTGCLEWCTRVAGQEPRPATLIMGAPLHEDWALEALRSGARGILCRSACTEQLIKAIRVVHEGQIWAPNQSVARALDLLSGLSTRSGANAGGALLHHLTRREQEVVRYVASGLSNREIGERMAISEATVKAHLTSTFRKLSVRGRTQLAGLWHDGTRPWVPSQRAIPRES